MPDVIASPSGNQPSRSSGSETSDLMVTLSITDSLRYQILKTDIVVRLNYPPLESPFNCFFSMHFTETNIITSEDLDDPVDEVAHLVRINRHYAETAADMVYGHVGPAGSHADAQHSRVIAIMLPPDEIQDWQNYAAPLRDHFVSHLGQMPYPVRCYIDASVDEAF